MSLKEYLGFNRGKHHRSVEREDDSDATKPLRKLTMGELVLGKINVLHLSPEVISDEQFEDAGTSISFPNKKIRKTLEGLGVENTRKDEEVVITIFHNQDNEGVLLKSTEFHLLYEPEEDGQLWKASDINREVVKYASDDALQYLSRLIDIYGKELESINRSGSS